MSGKPQYSFHASPMECARQMARRHSDIGFIRSYVLSHFGKAPTREQIAKMREEEVRRERWEAGKYDRAYLGSVSPGTREAARRGMA